jgi:hypothetical protein
MTCSRWIRTRTQPIARDDVLAYPEVGLTYDPGVYEIGGNDITTLLGPDPFVRLGAVAAPPAHRRPSLAPQALRLLGGSGHAGLRARPGRRDLAWYGTPT